MKNLFCLFFVIFSLFALVSCGGDENAQNDSEENNYSLTDENISISLRLAARDGESNTGNGSDATCMNINCIENLAAIAFKITNGKGDVVFQKSVKREELKNLKELTGIKDAENATLTVSIFEADSNLQANMNTVTWEGKATGLKFEKGETTTVDILLYPQAPNSHKIMPDGLTIPRFGHTATLLADGRILIAGGFTACGSNGKCQATDSVEIIDTESGMIETLKNMTERRAMHKAVAMGDGSVVFIGGVQGFNAVQQEEAFEGFPLLPYSQMSAVTFIERYIPSYPKHNMKINNLGNPIENNTQKINSQIPFNTFQSILTKKISDSKVDVYLVGGIDSENKPSNKSYKFSLTLADNGQLSVSTPTELAESSEPMLLPALAYSNGSILAVGGRPGSSEYTASLISESSSEDQGQNSGYNLFFSSSMDYNNNLYTFGGFNTEDGVITSSEHNKVLKWNPSSDSVTTGDNLRTWDKTIAFADTVYDEKNDSFLVIGGTNASDIFQIINATSLEFNESSSYIMSDKRIMPKTVVVPTGVITSNPIAIITGGTSELDGTGSAVKNIEISTL